MFALCVIFATVAADRDGVGGCPHPGWASHQLRIVAAQATSAINASNAPESLYGAEGGHIVSVDDTALYVAIAEFTAPPLFVPGVLSLWRADFNRSAAAGRSWPSGWRRVRNLFNSTARIDCTSKRASLGSSVSLAFNETAGRWELFYVGFISCNDTHFVNRKGRIFRAVSRVPGRGVAGIEGPYDDIGVVLEPGPDSQPWEGLQAVDSMQPYKTSSGWAAFYGGANTQDKPSTKGDNKTIQQRVGLTFAPSLSGPWTRSPDNPINLTHWPGAIEQPMVTQLRDGSYAAVFDALAHQGSGVVGYSWSPDGVQWDGRCAQLVSLWPEGRAPGWMSGGNGATRTPQGIVELGGANREVLLSFSGYDAVLPDGAGRHESLGIARLQFYTNSSLLL